MQVMPLAHAAPTAAGSAVPSSSLAAACGCRVPRCVLDEDRASTEAAGGATDLRERRSQSDRQVTSVRSKDHLHRRMITETPLAPFVAVVKRPRPQLRCSKDVIEPAPDTGRATNEDPAGRLGRVPVERSKYIGEIKRGKTDDDVSLSSIQARTGRSRGALGVK